MAIQPSNLRTPFTQTELSALSVSPLCGCQGVYTLHLLRACFTFMQSCFWSTWCRLQLNRRRCALNPPSSPFLPLSPLFPLPAPSSQNETGTAVTADVIATRHHWCYDNSKSSLSLIHRSILGCHRALQIMHRNTLRLRPFSPRCLWGERRTLAAFSRMLSLQILLFRPQRKEMKARLFSVQAKDEVKFTFKLRLIQTEKSRPESDSCWSYQFFCAIKRLQHLV